MTKPSSPDKSYSDIGQDIHAAGVYGNVVHNLTENRRGEVTAWFNKRQGQHNQGVAQWMIDFFKNAGATICIVDYTRSGAKPFAVTTLKKGKTTRIDPITRPELHDLIRSRSTFK